MLDLSSSFLVLYLTSVSDVDETVGLDAHGDIDNVDILLTEFLRTLLATLMTLMSAIALTRR